MIRPAQILALSLLTLGATLLHGVTAPAPGSQTAARPTDGARANQTAGMTAVRERAPRERTESRTRPEAVADATP
jgi:hypothetical protein